MFEQRSTQKELMDDTALANEALNKNLAELEIYNNWLGGKHTLLNALEKIYQKYANIINSREIIIADVGCGGGDLLEAIDKWLGKKPRRTKLLGIDVNPFVLEYAKRRVKHSNHFEFQITDATQAFPLVNADIICLNSVCHHFSDLQFVNLLKNLGQQTYLAIVINDLQRHRISYIAFKWLTRLLNFSYLAQHDAPLSVLRAFRKNELVHILQAAGINNYILRKTWFLRWQLIIWLK